MHCPYCGQVHPVGAVFCPKTGKRLEIQTTEDPTNLEFNTGKRHASGEIISEGSNFIAPNVPHQTVRESKQKYWMFLMIGGGILFLFGFIYFIVILTGQLSKPKPIVLVPYETPTAIVFSTEKPVTGKGGLQPPKSTYQETVQTEPSVTVAGLTPTSEPTLTLVLTLTPSPPPNNMIINEKDNAIMVNIPAGEFLMGSEPEWDPYYWGAEGPAHTVYLDSYWIYQTEVTNAQYETCVADHACPVPAYTKSETRTDYYGNPQYAAYPVVFVSYAHAVSYCDWAGGKLPTEAQWEKAARGVGDNLFPWGNRLPDESLTNYCDVNCTESYRDKQHDDGYRDTAPVGNYPAGASFYGVYDMSGNVWEWVFDYFNAGFYQTSIYDNPRGPSTSNTRVVRGGSFINEESGLRVVARYYQNPTRTQSYLGFRCVFNEYGMD